MRKLISLTLSILVILNTFGFNLIVIFLMHHSMTETLEIIEENSESINPKNITVFSLNDDKPEFVNSREIRYKNEMFDIIYKKDRAGDTIIYCVSDQKDTKLNIAFRSLNELNDNPSSVPDHLVDSILKNLLKNYLPGPEDKINRNSESFQFYDAGLLILPMVTPQRVYHPPQMQIIS
jgi:hypothetical protein